MQALLIWIDRLPYDLLGCYGNIDAETPGFDELAAAGVTFDYCYATDIRENGPTNALIKSLIAIAGHDVSVRVLGEGKSELCERLRAETGIGVQSIAETERPLEERVSEMQAAAIAEQPPATDSVRVIALQGGESVADVHRVDRVIAATTKQWSALVESPSLLIVTAGVGASVALDDSEPVSVKQLDERRIHVPLLALSREPLEFGVRCRSLVATWDVARRFAEWFRIDKGLRTSASPTNAGLLASLIGDAAEDVQPLILRGPHGLWGIRTPDWYLMTRLSEESAGNDSVDDGVESAALFVKPDDVWDQLNLASQSPDVVEQLTELLIATKEQTHQIEPQP